MSTIAAEKIIEKTFSDKYFKWAALGLGTVAVGGIALGGIYLWSKRPKLPDVPTDLSGLPSWLITPQDGGISPAGAVSPIIGLMELLGLRDKLGNDDVIESPEDLISCETGKPSMLRTVLLGLNPSLAVVYARACKKAQQQKVEQKKEEYMERYGPEAIRQMQEEADAQRAADRAIYEEDRRRQREAFDKERNNYQQQLNQARAELQEKLLEVSTMTFAPPTHVMGPKVPWWQEIFEDLAGMEWSDWKDQQGRQAVNDFLDPVTGGYKATNEHRVMAWYYFTKSIDHRSKQLVEEHAAELRRKHE